MNKKERLIQLIRFAGGIVEGDLFVTRPGCVIIEETRTTPKGEELSRLCNIDTTRPDYEQAGEFNGRITYLSFPDTAQSGEDYNRRMAEEHQHLSVFSTTYVTFLIAGISVECSMELVAHGEAKVARLTTSRTNAMDDTLYRLQYWGLPEALKAFTREFIALRRKYLNLHANGGQHGNELFNMLNLGTKATALTYTMSLKDFHKLFIGRIPQGGNEQEVIEIATMMCEQLHARYPLVVRDPKEYMMMKNGEKYRV